MDKTVAGLAAADNDIKDGGLAKYACALLQDEEFSLAQAVRENGSIY